MKIETFYITYQGQIVTSSNKSTHSLKFLMVFGEQIRIGGIGESYPQEEVMRPYNRDNPSNVRWGLTS